MAVAASSPPLEITRLHCERADDVPLITAYAEKAQAQLNAILRSGGTDPWRRIHPWTIACNMPYIHYIAHTASGDVYGWMTVLIHSKRAAGKEEADTYAFIAEVAAQSSIRGLGQRMHDQLVDETKDTLDFLYLYAVNESVASVYEARWGYSRIGDSLNMVRVLQNKPSKAFIESLKQEGSPLENVQSVLAPLYTTQNRHFMHLVRGLPSADASTSNLKQLAENVEIATGGEETEDAQRAAAVTLLEDFYVRRGAPVPTPRVVKAPVRLTYGPGWTQTEKGRRYSRRRRDRRRQRRRRTLRR